MFFGSCAGVFYCLNRDTGETVWEHDVSDGSKAMNFHGDVLLTPTLAIAGTDGFGEGRLYAFDRETGLVVWDLPLGRGVTSDVTEFEGLLFTSTLEDELLCLMPETGETVWEFVPDDADPTVDDVFTVTPIVDGEDLFWGTRLGEVIRLDPFTGEVIWQTRIGPDVSAGVLIHEGLVLAGTTDDVLIALDRETGRVAASLPLDATPRRLLTGFGGNVLVFTGWMQPFGEFVAVAPDLSEIRWAIPAPERSSWTTWRPFPDGDRVLAGTGDGHVCAVDPEQGDVTIIHRMDAMVRVFARDDDVLFVGSVSGEVVALR